MEISFISFINNLLTNPTLLIITILTLGTILVNGWTDAPNAIATCISTRSINVRHAIFMAAIMNFLGILVMTFINASITMTIYNMVDFGGNSGDALIALCAALFAIILWATAASLFGIPTSESHALIAGLSGAAIAIHNGFAGINGSEWIKVIYGLGLSTILGFLAGLITTKIIEFFFHKTHRKKANRFFKWTQIGGGAAMAFMHGAQDGQKFIAIFLLGISLSASQTGQTALVVPLWLILTCSVVMALGTCIGGMKIIKTVGTKMVKLQPYQGFAADTAAAGCLLASSLVGVPVSTTHTKTTSIMGVGAAKRMSAVNWGVVKEMLMAWILTFPGCGLIGFIMVKLFLIIF